MVIFRWGSWSLRKDQAVNWNWPWFERCTNGYFTSYWFGPYCLTHWHNNANA